MLVNLPCECVYVTASIIASLYHFVPKKRSRNSALHSSFLLNMLNPSPDPHLLPDDAQHPCMPIDYVGVR